MTRGDLMMLAAGGSLALLLGAFGFQYLAGLAPCPLCLWQRWPHALAIALAAAALFLGPLRAIAALGALALFGNTGIAVYHTGIERGWWPGPASCSGGGSLSGMSGEALLDFDASVSVVMCDEVAWSLLGLSMASWNALASLALAVIWIAAMRRAPA